MNKYWMILALVLSATSLQAEALPRLGGQKPAEEGQQDPKAEAVQRAREAEARKEAARKQTDAQREAEKVARKRAAKDAEKKAEEAEAVSRKRAAHAAKLDANAVRLVKANETKHRSRMARINKLAGIYRKKQATAKLAEIEELKKKEGARYRTSLIELEKQLGKNVVERILLSMKSEKAAPAGDKR